MIFTCPQCETIIPMRPSEFPLRCRCGHHSADGSDSLPAKGPSLMRKAANFSAALAAHAIDGRTVDDDVFAARSATCQQCLKYFDSATGICTHQNCGCGVAGPEGFVDKRRLASSHCPIGRWNRPQWITTEQRTRDTLTLLQQLPHDLSAIVGVARSGLAPAGMLAERLHLPLYVADEANVYLSGHGWRLREARLPDGPFLLCDDTLCTGRSLTRARAVMATAFPGKQYLTAVIYRDPECEVQVDHWVIDLKQPHLLEWNFFNSIFTDRCLYDIDGILCPDGYDPEVAPPLYLPRRKPIYLCSGRLERDREATLAWCEKWGIQVAGLFLFAGTEEERHVPMAVSRHKAGHYEAGRNFAPLDYFVESCPIQAQEIAGLTGLPVICPPVAKVF